MPVVTLTTDWKNNDYYIGAIKGKIISRVPDVTILDINHAVKEHDIMHASFVVRNSYQHFPDGSIHLISIHRSGKTKDKNLFIKANNQYFVGSDTGIFSLLGFENIEFIYEINIENPTPSFPEFGLFSEVICRFLSKEQPDTFGDRIEKVKELISLRPTIEPYGMDGHIIYIDSYGNAITNISSKMFYSAVKESRFAIYLGSFHHKIEELSVEYSDVPNGELFALFNSIGLLEVGMNEGHATSLLSMNVGTNIRVKTIKERPKPSNTGTLF